MATKKKKKHQFPTAYTVIIIVLLLVQLLTFVIPAGNYATIAYDTSNKDFVVTRPSGKKYKEPATAKNHANVQAERNSNILKFVVTPLVIIVIAAIYIPRKFWHRNLGKHAE